MKFYGVVAFFICFHILQSTVSVARNVNELESLMSDLPDYADQFLNMICKVLQDYKETCHSSYRGKCAACHVFHVFMRKMLIESTDYLNPI